MQAVKEAVALRNGVEMPLVGLGVMHTYLPVYAGTVSDRGRGYGHRRRRQLGPLYQAGGQRP